VVLAACSTITSITTYDKTLPKIQVKIKPLVHVAAEYSQFHSSVDTMAFQILHVYEPKNNSVHKKLKISVLTPISMCQ